MKPGDQAERDRAIHSPKNLAVTAGAGTGKTTLLVAKILRKVLDEGVPIERILALTFTEKAANEMRERLRKALAERGKAEGLEKAEIGTIHSFCAHVLRQFPIEAGVAPTFQVDEGAVFRRRFEEAWPRFLDEELGPGARRPRQWKDVLEKAGLREMRALAWGLCSFGVPEAREGGPALLRRLVDDLSARFPELGPALSGKGPLPKGSSKDSALAKSARKLAEDVARIDEASVAKAAGLVDGFARGFKRDFLRAGYVTFDAMLSLVHDLLQNPDFTNVRDLLRARYDYILVDEFQDTDPVQGQIIQRLAEGADGRLAPGKLFLVGDPKQSIYSFRGADIIAYQDLADRIQAEGGEPVVLRTNFRSHGEILGFVNAAFSRIIVENGKLQPRYEEIHPFGERRPKYDGPSIEAILVEEAGAEASREVEAVRIAEWILDRRKGGIPFRDVAVLFRSLVDVGMYIEALRSRGVPYVVEGEKYFYGTQEVIDFVNLLRAIANPHDRVALAGVLRSPFGGLTDQELYERRKGLDYLSGGDLPIFKFLRRWHERAGRVGVRELVDEVFAESWALEIAQAGYHGEQAVANLLKLRQKAGELEAHGGCTLQEFLATARQAVRELEEEGESPLADETLDAVRILSIHRSKGLEFPVVVLPDLHRQSVPHRAPGVAYDGPSGTLAVRLGEAMNAGGAALAFLDRERKREEWRRLLYVAVTRARERLLFLGAAGARDETYLGLLRGDLEARADVAMVPYARPPFAAPPPRPEKERPDWRSFVDLWRAREKRSAVVDPITSPSRLEDDGQERHLGGGGEGPSEEAARIGTACHRVLERLDFGAPRVPPDVPAEAREILERFFRSAAFRELAEAEILGRELPFLLPWEGRMVQGVIDVVYRSGGKLVVADYKTDKIMKPEAHARAAGIYGEAVRRVLGEEATVRLVYLRHGRGVEA